MAEAAHALFYEAKYTAAIKAYTALIKAGTDVKVQLCNRARSYLLLQMYNKAMKDADEALTLDPDLMTAHILKAEAYMGLNKVAEAHDICRQQLSNAKDLEIYEKLRNILDSKGSTTGQAPASAPSAAPTSTSSATSGPVSSKSPVSGSSVSTSVSNGTSSPAPKPAPAQVKPQGEKAEDKASNPKDINAEVLNNPAVLAALKSTNITHGVGNADVDKLIALGYYKVNNGLHTEAIAHFGEMLSKNPNLIAALVGRGTALALIGQYLAAENDFTKAILLQPQLADGYRRRAQVLGAMGKALEAVADLSSAIRIDPNFADSYFQRASILHKLGENNEALADIKKAVELEAGQKTYYTYLGLIHNSLGDGQEAIEAFQRALKVDPKFKDSHYGLGMTLRDLGNAAEALVCFNKAVELDPEFINAIHLRSFLYFTMGMHAMCIKDATRVIELDPKHKEGLYLKALSYHDLGQCHKAVKTYDILLKYYPDDAGWYNRECCLALHHSMDTPARAATWDAVHNVHFKEAWCKRTPPTQAKLRDYKPWPPLDPNIPDIPIGKTQPTLTEAALQLISAADRVGARLQLQTPGFIPNLRQHRMCGLAVIEAAQAVRSYWKGNSELGWRPMFDVLVRWRQLVEANDPVWWVDQLPQELFFEGFGLQTPMVTGQLKVPKYYPYFQRCFDIVKRLVQEQHVLTDAMADQVTKAQTLPELWKAMQRDFFIISPCYRLPLEEGEADPNGGCTAEERGWMEGTRITLVQKPEEHGYQFTIRTAGTPERYKEYFQEMDILWNRLTTEARNSDRSGNRLADIISSIYYFWVNFQPLTRGSAACGLMALMALFLAAGEELTSVVRSGVQTDWEGITTPFCSAFLAAFTPWLYENRCPSDLLDTLPAVAEVFSTYRQCVEALNHNLT